MIAILKTHKEGRMNQSWFNFFIFFIFFLSAFTSKINSKEVFNFSEDAYQEVTNHISHSCIEKDCENDIGFIPFLFSSRPFVKIESHQFFRKSSKSFNKTISFLQLDIPPPTSRN